MNNIAGIWKYTPQQFHFLKNTHEILEIKNTIK